MRHRNRLSLVAAVCAAIVAALATSVIGIAQSGPEPTATSAAGANSYPALERAQTTNDRLPDGILRQFGPDNARGPQIDPASSRKVGKVDRSDIYVATGAESFCTVSTDAGGWSGGCTSLARSASGEPQPTFDFVESADGNDHRVWGVAPAGVKSAAIVMSSGKRVDVPVVAGAFDVTTDEAGNAFTWSDADGVEHTQSIPTPPKQ